MTFYLDDRQQLILLMIEKKKTFQEMADTLGKSLRTVQKEIEYFLEEKLVEKDLTETGHSKITGRRLTAKGKGALQSYGHH